MKAAILLGCFLHLVYAQCETGWIETSSGTYCGVQDSLNGLERFLGIEYAKAKRWKQPVPIMEKHSYKLATAYGPQCP